MKYSAGTPPASLYRRACPSEHGRQAARSGGATPSGSCAYETVHLRDAAGGATELTRPLGS